MEYHKPTVSSPDILHTPNYYLHTHNSPRYAIVLRGGEQLTTHNFLYFLLLALLIVIPSVSLAQLNSQPTNDTNPDLSKLKITQPRIVLPEGYPINGRRAKLVKLPDDHRWFLVFDEAIQNLTPELVPKTDQKNEKSDVSLPKTVKKAPKTDQNLSKPDNNLSRAYAEKNLESDNPFCHPIEVLPGKWLTAMIMHIGNRLDLSVDFRVWGEITTYHNRNYILLTRVDNLDLFGPDAALKAKTTKKINPLESTFGPPKTTESKISKQTQILDKSSLPKKLRDALMSIPRTRPLELPDVKQIQTHPKPAAAIPISSDVKKTSKQNNWRDGYMIIDRMGRIHFDPEGLRWLFTLEADGASLSEPPVTLYPCRLLEIMEDAVGRSPDTLRFRISGQINQYQGRNYLLLRKVLMVYDLGNLVK